MTAIEITHLTGFTLLLLLRIQRHMWRNCYTAYCQFIYLSSVIERTWWPGLLRLIALLVSVAWPFHLSLD